jgi:hypothetical protein
VTKLGTRLARLPFIMKLLALAALAVAGTLPLHADTLAEVRAAVTALKGAQPIRATAELKRTDKEAGRFSNDSFTGAATVDIGLDGDGVHISFSPAVVEQFVREQREHTANPKVVDATSRTAGHVGPLWVLEHLNAADTFLGMLRYAKLQSETRAAWQSRPARLLLFRIEEPAPEGMKGIGSVEVKQHQLKVWIGEDNLPLAAERERDGTARIFFFHGSIKSRDSWSFARVADHLVIVRHATSHNADMLGQKSDGQSSDLLTVR